MITTAAARPERRAAFDRRALPAYAVLVAVWAIAFIASPWRGLHISPDFLLLASAGALVMWACWCARLRGFDGVATAIESWVVLALICLGFVLVSYVLATLGFRYADRTFDLLDRIIAPGFDWSRDVRAFSRWPVLLDLANKAYESPWSQATFFFALCALANRADRSWRFVLAWAAALAITMAIFTFVPAQGAYALHGIAHSEVTGVLNTVGWRQPEMLELLRGPGPVSIGSGDVVGIVEFPSFHAASAILLCWAFWPWPACRAAALALNACMILSAIPIGGHYIVDLIAGLMVGAAGIRIAGHVQSRGWTTKGGTV